MSFVRVCTPGGSCSLIPTATALATGSCYSGIVQYWGGYKEALVSATHSIRQSEAIAMPLLCSTAGVIVYLFPTIHEQVLNHHLHEIIATNVEAILEDINE